MPVVCNSGSKSKSPRGIRLKLQSVWSLLINLAPNSIVPSPILCATSVQRIKKTPSCCEVDAEQTPATLFGKKGTRIAIEQFVAKAHVGVAAKFGRGDDRLNPREMAYY